MWEFVVVAHSPCAAERCAAGAKTPTPQSERRRKTGQKFFCGPDSAIDPPSPGPIIPRMDAATQLAQPSAHARYGAILDRLRAGEPADRRAGADELVGLVAERLRYMARRMLRGFPTVRRFSETDDIAQGAALRLHRALATVTPACPREFLGLVALQVRRELVDLARKFSGPESLARHLDTDVVSDGEAAVCRTETARDELAAAERESLGRWVRFHEVAAELPDEERAVFEMVWYLGATQAGIADVLGCSERTVRRRWESAREFFQTRFQGDLP